MEEHILTESEVKLAIKTNLIFISDSLDTFSDNLDYKILIKFNSDITELYNNLKHHENKI